MFKHILVPTDGSELSQKAIDGAIDLAQSVGARASRLMRACRNTLTRRSRTLPSSRPTTSTPAPRTKRASICARSSAPPKTRACRAPA